MFGLFGYGCVFSSWESLDSALRCGLDRDIDLAAGAGNVETKTWWQDVGTNHQIIPQKASIRKGQQNWTTKGYSKGYCTVGIYWIWGPEAGWDRWEPLFGGNSNGSPCGLSCTSLTQPYHLKATESVNPISMFDQKDPKGVACYVCVVLRCNCRTAFPTSFYIVLKHIHLPV